MKFLQRAEHLAVVREGEDVIKDVEGIEKVLKVNGLKPHMF